MTAPEPEAATVSGSSVSRPCARCGERPRKTTAAGRTYTWCRECLTRYSVARRSAMRALARPKLAEPTRLEGRLRLSIAPGRGSAPDRTVVVFDRPGVVRETLELDHWQLTPWLDAAIRWANRHGLEKVLTVWPAADGFDGALAERLVARVLGIYGIDEAYGLPLDLDEAD